MRYEIRPNYSSALGDCWVVWDTLAKASVRLYIAKRDAETEAERMNTEWKS